MPHTPGPWTLSVPDADDVHEEFHDEELKHPLTGHASVSGPEWASFAQVCMFVNGVRVAAGEANARLIAAAPALLAACKSVVRAWDAFEYDEAGVPRFDSMNRFAHAMDDAHQAIALAEPKETA
jgi:hypothetical protein